MGEIDPATSGGRLLGLLLRAAGLEGGGGGGGSSDAGGLLAGALTVAVNDTVVLVVPSFAVTDMLEEPAATGVSVSVEPETLAVT